MTFVHLHVHSEYSLLDGFSNIKKLVQRAGEMGMKSLALTDHGTMFGVIDFYKAAQASGIKPIIGLEAYLAPRSMRDRDPHEDKRAAHLLLLAENDTGYRNLLKIASAAQLEGFYYTPRIDAGFLEEHAEGLICTTGCMSGEVPRLIAQGRPDEARRKLDWYYEVFGPQNFFLELQRHNIPELTMVNQQLLEMGARYQARYIATNDVHYIEPEDARLQDIMLAIQTGSVLTDPNRMRMTDNSYYLRSPEEMARLFSETPEALGNTLLIAERCEVNLDFDGYRLPHFDVPEGYSAESYLHELCEAGLKRRYGERSEHADVRQRLDYELGVIHKMGFDAYFLIVWDLCRYARQQGIWYNARGSAAASIVAYGLDITLVDPIQHGLIFERFLNPGRISMPDIDLDFRDDRRAEMMEYATRKYGEDKVAQIITFGTLGARAAIRDVGRVMDIPLTEIDRVAKLIPNIPGKPMSISQALEEIKEFKELYDSTDYLRELIDTACKMEGVVRNAGTHAAGVIITDQPVIEYIPLHRPTGSTAEESPVKIVTQFEMSVLESLGLLKVDFLGLATLTIMARACDMIQQRYNVRLHLGNISTDDPATYELLGRGDTAGVFQVEGAGMRRYLMQMKPKELANVIAMVALFRPGPMDSIPGYIRRMHGQEAVEYTHPALEPIFKETYGYPVYQEQLMRAVMDLAGYSAPEADDLRKAISKKLKDKLLEHRKKFVEGSVSKGIPQEKAEKIFDDWEEFARYGFNKAHAADYGVIAVQTAYLKAHYPVEYMTALLSVTRNDTEKVALYVADCRRMGIDVRPPDVNASDWDFTIEDERDEAGKIKSAAIRFGLGAVKNAGHGPVEAILAGREGRPFQDLNDFAQRVDLRQVGKRSLESLVRVGALDQFGPRNALLASLDIILSVSTASFRAAEMGQMTLFGEHTGINEAIVLPRSVAEVSRREMLNWEKELIGLYVSDHPLSPVMNEITQVITHFSGQLSEASPDETVRVAGLVTRVRHYQSKAGNAMAFVTLEDVQGKIELVIFPKVWAQAAKLVEYDKVILVEGRVEGEGGDPKVIAQRVSSELKITSAAGEKTTSGINGVGAKVRREAAKPGAPVRSAAPVQVGSEPPAQEEEVYEPPVEAVEETWEGNCPPPPEPFPDGWAPTAAVGKETIASEAAQVEGAPGTNPPDPLVELNPEAAPEAPQEEVEPVTAAEIIAGEAVEEAPTAQAPAIGARTGAALEAVQEQAAAEPPPFILPPAPASAEGNVHMITVFLRTTGDKTHDVLRMRRIHHNIASFPGNDRFAFWVYERGRNYLVEFPNESTGVCQELLEKLGGMVGPENVHIEKIRFQ